MLFRADILRGIAEGRINLAFRRWRRRPPAAGSTLRTPIGVLSLDQVRVIDDGDITADDIARCGATSAAALRDELGGEGSLLRIEVRLIGEDPRLALRERAPDPDEALAIAARLARLDASSPWTMRVLQMIGDAPGTVSHVLAGRLGVETPVLKRRVRQLKELGLTESLEVGYRLSARGRAVLDQQHRDGA
jgi:hypothetical protein